MKTVIKLKDYCIDYIITLFMLHSLWLYANSERGILKTSVLLSQNVFFFHLLYVNRYIKKILKDKVPKFCVRFFRYIFFY